MHSHDDDGTALQTAAKKIQGMYRVRMARRRLRQLLKAVVERFYDEDSGSMYYYYNAKTGESSWLKPTLLGSEDANLAAMYHTTPAQATVVSIEQPVNELATQPDSRIETPQLPSSHVDDAERPQLNDTHEPFSPEELALIHEQFHKFDKDGSGCITADEMMAIMHAFGDTSTLETIQGFATLLHLGVAKGLLKDLGSVMNATGARVSAWWYVAILTGSL
ncbi:hypothetical protein DYB31_008852 [Aphanomyces astaci]|uniref:Uncharacterized protein n=1 Tax=Aphanomyces astaci TaxID=112090 RepID=A0A397FAC1_APHAT|nr:hypothetical protein DYB31_008852 [Aphanomyces astaci]